ncbi:MAG TPA: hypothetical protein VL574_00785, partial [Stellaceae bacterium]|nr:hypothetical protein [Stellaceae bacterium]
MRKFGYALLGGLFAACLIQGAQAADTPSTPDTPAKAGAPAKYNPFKPFAAKNMKVIGYNDLGGVGKGGEGMAMRKYPDGRRILFLAHESEPACFSVLDVTDPTKPVLITQTKVEA